VGVYPAPVPRREYSVRPHGPSRVLALLLAEPEGYELPWKG